jgi:hypothetical protein
MPRVPLVLALVLVAPACGHPREATHDAPATGDARDDAAGPHDAAGDAHGLVDAPRDAPRDAAATIDAFPSVLDVRIDCHNTCVLTAHPAAINVHAGTSFQVNWINVGDTQCDVTKVDQFNHVPIIIGLDPGTSYHDPVHDWCGTQFTGTFDFEILICTEPNEIPVNCGA